MGPVTFHPWVPTIFISAEAVAPWAIEHCAFVFKSFEKNNESVTRNSILCCTLMDRRTVGSRRTVRTSDNVKQWSFFVLISRFARTFLGSPNSSLSNYFLWRHLKARVWSYSRFEGSYLRESRPN